MTRFRTFRLLLSCCLLATLLTSCSRNPDVRKKKYFESGEKYFAAGKYREAAIQYSNAVQIDPRFADAHYQLSQAYLKLGDAPRAYQELSRTVELVPDNYPAQTDLANLLVTSRNPDGSPVQEDLHKAKEHLDILKQKRPNSPETHEAWANYYAAQSQLPAAIDEMQQAIQLDPNRSESYLQLALLQQQNKQFQEAETNYIKAVTVDPKAMNAQLALGGFYESQKRLPEAEKQFRQAVGLEPKNPAPREAIVQLLMLQGRKAEAESFLQQTKKDLADIPEGYRMLGDFYFATGDVDKALAEYTAIHDAHPKDIKAKKNFIQLLILKNRLDEATKWNDEILKSSPHDVDALIYRGQIQRVRGDSAGSIQSVQEALRNDPENAIAHYQLGLAYAQQNDIGKAESEWREAVRISPQLTDAQRALVRVEIAKGDVDAVLETAQEIIETQPNAPDGYLFRSVAHLARQKYADAQRDSEQAQERAPQSALPYIQLAAVQFAQKHIPQAEQLYQQALDKDPSNADALSGYMNACIAEKQPDKAIAAANAQIAKNPTSNFYDLLGTALFNGKKDYPGADAALRKAIELDKNNVDAVEKLGKVQVQEGSPDQALALYLQSIKDNPKEVRFYILAGELYEAKQNLDQAKALYQQALAIAPDHPLASNNLAYVLLQQGGNIDIAMNMAQTARRGMPDSPNAADTLGWAYYQKGIYNSAVSQFQEALRLQEKQGSPDDAVLHYHLGMAYQKLNQIPLARQQFERAVKISPTNADARKALSQLRS